VAPAVLRPRHFAVAGIQRFLLAEADRGEGTRLDPEGYEIALGALGAALAQRNVVLGGPALVAVSLDAPGFACR
jgi:hypothetical protein